MQHIITRKESGDFEYQGEEYCFIGYFLLKIAEQHGINAAHCKSESHIFSVLQAHKIDVRIVEEDGTDAEW